MSAAGNGGKNGRRFRDVDVVSDRLSDASRVTGGRGDAVARGANLRARHAGAPAGAENPTHHPGDAVSLSMAGAAGPGRDRPIPLLSGLDPSGKMTPFLATSPLAPWRASAPPMRTGMARFACLDSNIGLVDSKPHPFDEGETDAAIRKVLVEQRRDQSRLKLPELEPVGAGEISDGVPDGRALDDDEATVVRRVARRVASVLHRAPWWLYLVIATLVFPQFFLQLGMAIAFTGTVLALIYLPQLVRDGALREALVGRVSWPLARLRWARSAWNLAARWQRRTTPRVRSYWARGIRGAHHILCLIQDRIRHGLGLAPTGRMGSRRLPTDTTPPGDKFSPH